MVNLMKTGSTKLFVVLFLLAWGCGGERSESVQVRSAGLELRVSVEPAALRVGENSIWVELRDAEGTLVTDAEVEVEVRMHAMGAMPAMGGPAAVREVGDGLHRADFALDMGGSWNVAIAARPPGGPTARAEGSLTVGTPGLRLEGVGSISGSESESRAGAAAERESGSGSEPAPSAGVHGHGNGPVRTGPGVDDAPGPNGPRVADGARHPAELRFPPERLQRIGVRIAPVERRALTTSIRAFGRVVVDETTLEDVSLKVHGWVERVDADALGDPVRKGDVLFTIYSPELHAAQEEYLQALRSQARARETGAPERADYLVRSARNRLRLWDIAEPDLERLVQRGEPSEQLPIRSPVSGYVIEKNLVEGSAFSPGQRLYRIAPLARVWIEAEVYESELPLVEVGQTATVSLPHRPGRDLEATIAYVHPTLDPKTRTARLRLELPNPELVLRPDMYANVAIRVERGERLVVPESAILHGGERSFVFLSLGDGRFQPRAVEIGLRSGELVEILSGLESGDEIVRSGTFLIASESRLRAAMEQW